MHIDSLFLSLIDGHWSLHNAVGQVSRGIVLVRPTVRSRVTLSDYPRNGL